jgi:hypothetical protein
VWRQILFVQIERGVISSEDAGAELTDDTAPRTVADSPRLADDVKALIYILGGDSSPLVQLRLRKIISVVFGFGDASRTGLGATFTCENRFTFRIGVCGSLERMK